MAYRRSYDQNTDEKGAEMRSKQRQRLIILCSLSFLILLFALVAMMLVV